MFLLVRLTEKILFYPLRSRKPSFRLKIPFRRRESHAEPQTADKNLFFPKIYPLCQRNGVLTFFDKIAVFFGGFVPFGSVDNLFRKSFVFLYALILRFLHTLLSRPPDNPRGSRLYQWFSKIPIHRA